MAGKLILKIISGCLILTVIGGVSAVVGSADVLSDYEKKQKELDSQAREYQSIIDQTANDIEKTEEYQQALLNKISTLNEQIADGREEIASLDLQITDLQAEIDDAESGISDRIDLLKARLKAIYLSGETTSLEIILGAKDFEDFLDKIEIVSYISNSDKKMIDELEGEIRIINAKKEEVAQKKDSLSSEQNDLNTRQQEMQRLVDENEALLGDLYADNAAAQDHLDENNEEMQEIEDAIKAYYADKAAQQEAARIASEAQKELEASRAAYESKIQNNSSEATPSVVGSGIIKGNNDTTSRIEYSQTTTSSNTESKAESSSKVSSSQTVTSNEPSSQVPSVSSEEKSPDSTIPTTSGYVWPVPGHYTLTSTWNEDRGSYNHGAIDISDGSILNAEIVAAESGTVVLSNDDCTHNYGKEDSCGCGGGYGNYLMIDHGDGKATLYAHMTSLTVSSGTYVQKGQVIGYVGSTGWSTGPHLHFETRLNGEKYNPMTEYPNM